MVTVTELNRAPDGRFESLEADTITDGANVSHSDELADLADVSAIQSSSDVTVTDTQPGTVSDGEFLQNSGGNLTGGTVQTEPNVPGWEEDGNSPINISSQSSVTHTLASDYDRILILNDPTSSNGFDNLTVNGVTSGYSYVAENGSETSSASQWEIPNAIQRTAITLYSANAVKLRVQPATSFSGATTMGQCGDASTPINSFTLSDSGGGTQSTYAKVYGLDTSP